MSRVILRLDGPGATEEQLQAGLRAAATYFLRENIQPSNLAAARFSREGATMTDTAEQAAMAYVWQRAQAIALETCLGSGVPIPNGSYLELVDPSTYSWEEHYSDRIGAEEDFAASEEHFGGGPPRDPDRVFVGRARDGEIAHFRWRTHPHLDRKKDRPYWARMEDDEIFKFVEWAPTKFSHHQIAELYD